jgi:hypothetical protein
LRRGVFVGLALACACGGDVCEDGAPAAQITVQVAPAIGARVERIDVELDLGGTTYTNSYETAGRLDDGETAFAVDLGAMRVTEPTMLAVRVTAYEAMQVVSSGAQQATVSADACNTIVVALGGGGGCGDGALDGGEACDGQAFGDDSCLARGRRTGGGLVCTPSCVVDASGCGPVIDTPEALVSAVAEANARDVATTIAIPAGTYTLTAPLVLSGPAITLEPMDGVVRLSGDVAVRVESAGSTVRNLAFVDVTTAVVIDAQDVTFSGNAVRAETRAGAALVQVEMTAAAARVSANHFLSTPTSQSAIVIDGAQDTRVEMNVIDGAYTYAVDVARPGGALKLDQNSLRLGAGTGVRFDARPNATLCVRNNAIVVDANATAFDVSMQARFGACDAIDTGHNAVGGAGTPCSGTCGLCAGAGPLCAAEAAFADEALCPATGSALIDDGADLGLDLVDDDEARFLGARPDVGAREAGSTRAFGGAASTCP